MIEKFENLTVSKATITRLFIVAVALALAGLVGSIAVVIWALGNGAITFGGTQFLAVNAGAFAGAIAGLVLASLLAGIGTAAAVVAWAGAVLNTARLDDKSWFTALVVLGLVSFGWLALIGYVLYGPDSTQAQAGVTA